MLKMFLKNPYLCRVQIYLDAQLGTVTQFSLLDRFNRFKELKNSTWLRLPS